MDPSYGIGYDYSRGFEVGFTLVNCDFSDSYKAWGSKKNLEEEPKDDLLRYIIGCTQSFSDNMSGCLEKSNFMSKRQR